MHAIVTIRNTTKIINLENNTMNNFEHDCTGLITFGRNSFGILQNKSLLLFDEKGNNTKTIENTIFIIQGEFNEPFIAIRENIIASPEYQTRHSDIPVNTFYFELFSVDGNSLTSNLNRSWYSNISNDVVIMSSDSDWEQQTMPHFPSDTQTTWGVSDFRGNILIPAAYQEIRPFRDSVAAVKNKNKWGYIDKSGNIICDCIYEYALSWRAGYGIVRNNNKWGIIDKTGAVIVPFTYKLLTWGASDQVLFADSAEFSPGTMQFPGISRGTNRGIINLETRKPISFTAYDIEYLENDRYKIQVNADSNSFKLYDATLSPVNNNSFQQIRSFNNGYAIAKDNEKWGVIDEYGKWILKPEFDSVISLF